MLRLETQFEYSTHHWFLSRTQDDLVTGNREHLEDIDKSIKSHGWFNYKCGRESRYLLCPLASWGDE